MDENLKDLVIEGVGTVYFNKQKIYTIDMDKVLESKDINEKLNALFSLLNEMHITIEEKVLTEQLKKFVKEI